MNKLLVSMAIFVIAVFAAAGPVRAGGYDKYDNHKDYHSDKEYKKDRHDYKYEKKDYKDRKDWSYYWDWCTKFLSHGKYDRNNYTSYHW